MNAAEQILLRLEAYECVGSRARVSARTQARQRVEPVVVGGGAADFGLTLGNNQSVAELQNIMTSWAYRMKQLSDAYTAFAPTWQAKDSTAFTNWLADWIQLNTRYQAALTNAQAAVSNASSLMPNSMQSAQAEFDGLMKAMRQSYPPDGGPVTKGDFDDLNSRLSTAGTTVSYANMPQPAKGSDLTSTIFVATAPLDVVAMATGEQKPKIPGMGFVAWLVTHKKAVIVTGAVVVGGILFIQVAPVLMLPFKAAKGLGALAAV